LRPLEDTHAFLIEPAGFPDGFLQRIVFLGINSRSYHQLWSHGPLLEATDTLPGQLAIVSYDFVSVKNTAPAHHLFISFRFS